MLSIVCIHLLYLKSEIMKLAILLVFCCAIAINVNAKLLRIYGDIKNYKHIGERFVFLPMDFNGRVERNVTFPKVKNIFFQQLQAKKLILRISLSSGFYFTKIRDPRNQTLRLRR